MRPEEIVLSMKCLPQKNEDLNSIPSIHVVRWACSNFSTGRQRQTDSWGLASSSVSRPVTDLIENQNGWLLRNESCVYIHTCTHAYLCKHTQMSDVDRVLQAHNVEYHSKCSKAAYSWKMLGTQCLWGDCVQGNPKQKSPNFHTEFLMNTSLVLGQSQLFSRRSSFDFTSQQREV